MALTLASGFAVGGVAAWALRRNRLRREAAGNSGGAPKKRGDADVVPGMFIGHQWMGLGEMEKYRAEQAAGWGYAVFVPDLYGTGIRPTTPDTARAAMAKAEANLTWFHAAL